MKKAFAAKVERMDVAHPGSVKCPRCRVWGYWDLNYDNLCNRCVLIIVTEFKEHASVPHILQNLADRGLDIKDNPCYKEEK